MEKLPFERPIIKKLNVGMPNKFGMRSEFMPITHIDTVSVKSMIQQHGSPVYVISEATIRKTYKEAKRAFTTRYPKVQFAWSYKTNYMNAVCKVFHQEGSWAEVVSGFEYEKALANGVDGKYIIFNGPDKTEKDLALAVNNQSLIHIDHLDELYTLLEIADKIKQIPRIAIRVNLDAGIHPQWDRFGFNYENGEAWDVLNKIMISGKLDLVGLHSHIGTYIMTASAYSVAASKLADLAFHVEKKYKHAIKYIDLGGGFASKNTLRGAYLPGSDTCPTFDQYAEAITTAIMNSQIKPENLPIIVLETGRALIDDAGYLLGSVIANKRLASGKRATIIDIGVNLLFTAFWYEHKITPAQAFSHHHEDTIIYGPLCMNIDVIREHISMPVLKRGDHIVISRIGAYNMTQWLQFINMRPKILLIDTNNQVHVIREAENTQTLTDLEKVPTHLTKFEL